jgi:hypothetical protein
VNLLQNWVVLLWQTCKHENLSMENLLLHNNHWKNKQMVTVWQGWTMMKWLQNLWVSEGLLGCDRRHNRDAGLARL